MECCGRAVLFNNYMTVYQFWRVQWPRKLRWRVLLSTRSGVYTLGLTYMFSLVSVALFLIASVSLIRDRGVWRKCWYSMVWFLIMQDISRSGLWCAGRFNNNILERGGYNWSTIISKHLGSVLRASALRVREIQLQTYGFANHVKSGFDDSRWWIGNCCLNGSECVHIMYDLFSSVHMQVPLLILLTEFRSVSVRVLTRKIESFS